MKKTISLSAVLLATMVSSLMADDVLLTAELDKACTFTGSLTGSVPPVPFVIHTVGNLGFSCNYAGTVMIGMETADGTVLKVPGEPLSGALYQIKWLVPPNMPWNSSGTHAVFGPWLGDTLPTPNEVRSEPVKVQILEPMTIGGTYTDTVTFTVTPN
jgi:hypothetical protein